tara:strand:+ start:313 stop:780 length:468 start_codon:yes stop_codon:yes gene_type:complete
MEDQFPRSGQVEWIGGADARNGTVESAASCQMEPGSGIVGEHHASAGTTHREVTLIQYEHLGAIAALAGQDEVDPSDLRRNVVVSGINLLALQDRTFEIGNVTLEGTGPCVPCERMEQNLGAGGYNAMNGHGGICARVVKGGTVNVGDTVTVPTL